MVSRSYSFTLRLAPDAVLFLVCIWDRDNSPDDRSIPLFLEGPVLISRSPMLHPGDVRMVSIIMKRS